MRSASTVSTNIARDTHGNTENIASIIRGHEQFERRVTAALERYAGWRDERHPGDHSHAFFTDTSGEWVKNMTVRDAFVHASTAAGLRTAAQQPRMHDLRHTFAVNTLLGWYREGADVAATMPALSTYVGHSDPANTYWYVSAVPELLAHAALAGAVPSAFPVRSNMQKSFSDT